MMTRRMDVALVGCCLACVSQAWAGPAITVYNQNFAVVRDTVPLDLKAGTNDVRFAEVTYQLEPDSVILRDPAGKHRLQVLEQNYRNDPVSQGLLLSLCEGKTIAFLIKGEDGKDDKTVQGRIVRSGYLPPMRSEGHYGPPITSEPIIEIDGKLQFALPGLPLFADLSDKTVLKPTLSWLIETDQAGAFDAELAYVTAGMSWEADYNLVAPEKGDLVDVVGWVTINNQTGKAFENAKVKLMAGDVNKVQPPAPRQMPAMARVATAAEMAPPVTEKAFEEYHLYSLARPTTLLDRQTKQVEFVRGNGVRAPSIYVYKGADFNHYASWSLDAVRQNPDYGVQSNTKVYVMREFKNSEANHLGVPLPKGRMRFYRQDDDRQLEFIGENTIDHTAKDELVRMYIGNAFDLVGERKRTAFEPARRSMREGYEITLRNHKKEPVEIRVVEPLYPWGTAEIVEKSADFTKMDAHTIELRVMVPPDGEKVVSYTAKYTW
jgi:hypothetical protein